MVGENTNQNSRSALLPLRHPQQDFFVCDIFDAIPKGDMASMEHPVFSVSTKPDLTIREYTNGQYRLKVRPSSDGLATVHDRDILIYCTSQIMAAVNRDRPASQTVRFKAHDLLIATNRGTDGRGYEQLKSALRRLQGTQIETNIETGGKVHWEIFSLIDRVSIKRESFDGRMIDVEIKLSDWMFEAIKEKEVLTLHRDYFRLRKPIERRLYEIARKHCGINPAHIVHFKISTLHLKCGSQSSPKEFKRLVGAIINQDKTNDHFPDYSIRFSDDEKLIIFNPKRKAKQLIQSFDFPRISEEAREKARSIARGYDVYALEADFVAYWSDKGSQPLKNTDAAFLGWCKKLNERNPIR